MKVSVIVPCYNEEEALPVFYREINRTIRTMNCEYELLFIDDGSMDGTLSVLKELAGEDAHVFYLSFSRNYGKEAAMYAGFCNVSGDYVTVMDADLQDPPHLLPEMLQILQSGEYDCVAARRGDRNGEPPVRSAFSGLFYKMINQLSDTQIVDGARDFRMMRREMADAIAAMTEANRFSKGIFGWVGFRTHWISYENVERVAGQTKWTFWQLCRYALDGILNFSQAPLAMVSWFGMLMTGISFLMLLVVIIRKLLFGDPVAGWASTICVIIFIGGIQMFCLGIIGQYIAKMYIETKNRPHYIARESNLKDPKLLR